MTEDGEDGLQDAASERKDAILKASWRALGRSWRVLGPSGAVKSPVQSQVVSCLCGVDGMANVV